MKIEIQNLEFAYDSEKVLQNVNLSYDSQDFLSIIGPNGGGKSTLLKLMVGLLKPSSGEILIDDKTPTKISEFIGYVPQNIPINRVFPVSVLEVALMGRIHARTFGFYGAKDKKLAMEALAKVSMEKFANRAISELSGGQRQRVYIARALCSDAKILMLDEPTASIDARGQTEIYGILRDINSSGTGVVMVSHDVNIAINFASKVAYVNRELFLHEINGENRGEFISHLAKNHSHFCDVELVLGVCDCQKTANSHINFGANSDANSQSRLNFGANSREFIKKDANA